MPLATPKKFPFSLALRPDDDLRAVWRAADGLGYPYGPLVRLLMLTGQRRAEVGEAQWCEFDLERRLWTITAARFKSDAVHVLPLSDEAMAILEALPRWRGGDFVFSTNGGRKPVDGFSYAKARIDKLVAAQRGRAAEPWVFHDLHRTVRTRLSALRVPHEVAELVIGHARKGFARIYGAPFQPGEREMLADYLEGKLARGRRCPRHVFPFDWPAATEIGVWQDMRARHGAGQLRRGALNQLLEAAADRTGLSADSTRKAYRRLPDPKRPRHVAHVLDGSVYSGRHVSAPGPGRGEKDRSTWRRALAEEFGRRR
jgi:hypothetical protein